MSRSILILDEKDIKEMVAEKYDVLESQVTIIKGLKTIGYGLSEEQVPDFRVEIEL